MKSYKIYLTKSAEVARLIFDGAQNQLGKDGVIRVLSGIVDDNDEAIPSIYKGKGYWQIMVISDSDTDTSEVIVA